MSLPEHFVLAFPSGSLQYDCAPCGKCCRGGGLSALHKSEAVSHALPIYAPFVDTREDDAFLNFHTYDDGCRFLADDNACMIHRDHGIEAKPLMCRLFPLNLALEVDGNVMILPHHRCPWRADPTGKSLQSAHSQVLAQLAHVPWENAAPKPWPTQTSLSQKARLALEQDLARIITAAAGLEDLQAKYRARCAQEADITEAYPLDLWADLLRTAGPPKPLSNELEAMLITAWHGIHIILGRYFALQELPNAMDAFVFWLRAMQENGPLGDDAVTLFRWLSASLPWVGLLARAKLTLPKLGAAPATLHPNAVALWNLWRQSPGEPVGLTSLSALRQVQVGAIFVLGQCAAALFDLRGLHRL